MGVLQRCASARQRSQRGVVALEFALVFLFGMLPLLLLTVSGVLIFAAQQSLTLAAANGARAALRHGTTGSIAERRQSACQVAAQSMAWLLTFSGSTPDCTNAPIVVTSATCDGVTCVTVATSFDYDKHPFLPGTAIVYGWVLGRSLTSSATVQLDSTDT
ncbi:pilus assembly protein [Rhodanobacter sp. Col0626]|uniref:pilus assembly protein n=1 Tax=Rhodanobacter sp. Col0626 TaxID=3415679 RepID=UPI003CE9FBBF